MNDDRSPALALANAEELSQIGGGVAEPDQGEAVEAALKARIRKYTALNAALKDHLVELEAAHGKRDKAMLSFLDHLMLSYETTLDQQSLSLERSHQIIQAETQRKKELELYQQNLMRAEELAVVKQQELVNLRVDLKNIRKQITTEREQTRQKLAEET